MIHNDEFPAHSAAEVQEQIVGLLICRKNEGEIEDQRSLFALDPVDTCPILRRRIFKIQPAALKHDIGRLISRT